MNLMLKFVNGDRLDDQELDDLHQELDQIVEDLPLLSDSTTTQQLVKFAGYQYMASIKSIQNARKENNYEL